MPIIQSSYGPKPAQVLAGGRVGGLPTTSTSFLPGVRSIALTGDGFRTVSFAELYRTQPIIGLAIRRTVSAIARLPINVYRWVDDEGEERERARTHPGAQLLNRPRPGRTGFNLRWEIAMSKYTHGNWVGWKRRRSVGGPPYELWTLDWRYIDPILAGDGTGPVLGWVWRGQGIPGLKRGQIIPPEDAIHIAFEGAAGAVGVSPLEQLGVTVRSEDAIQRHGESYFKHGTRFGAAAILDKNVKADQVMRDGVREEMAAVHGGADNAYRFAVLGGGITDLKIIGGQTAVEAELINQRKVNREEALAALDMPPPLAGFLEDSNYSSIKEVHRLLYVTVLPGPLGNISAGLQGQLLDPVAEPAWGDDEVYNEFNLSDVLRGDAKERWETYGTALDHGGLTLNDVRRMENLTPYDDPRANEPLIAANNVRPLSAVGTGDDDAATGIASNIVKLVGKHADRALERAARKMTDDLAPAAALDADRVARELAADLKSGAGLNGSSEPIAEAVAKDLVDRLEGVTDAAAVKRIRLDYLGGNPR